jgi:hypothetical protein
MSNEPKLGKTLDEFTKDRDAIHIAITPVIAMEELSPGEPIGLVEPGNNEMVGSVAEPIGIVDPFLKEKVQIGDRFYLFLYQALRRHQGVREVAAGLLAKQRP